MSDSQPVLDQVNLVAGDIDATIAFYSRLGSPMSDSGEDWPPGSGARHVEVAHGQRHEPRVRQRDRAGRCGTAVCATVTRTRRRTRPR